MFPNNVSYCSNCMSLFCVGTAFIQVFGPEMRVASWVVCLFVCICLHCCICLLLFSHCSALSLSGGLFTCGEQKGSVGIRHEFPPKGEQR